MKKNKLIAFVVMALLILVGAGIIESISPDRRGGDYCPKCMSSDIGEFFYGYYKQGENDSIDNAVRSNRLIPGGCILDGSNPKYRCNSCYYEWGNYR